MTDEVTAFTVEVHEGMTDRVDDFLDKVVLPPQTGMLNTAAAAVRVVLGLALIAVSVSKFADHDAMVSSFVDWGVPNADRAVTLAGIVELVGGVLLVAGLMTRIVALFLALHFAVALGTGGRVEQDAYHLGLGTILLAGSLFLVWAGSGPWSADAKIYERRREFF